MSAPDFKLARQVYGMAMAQGRFGGPVGIWLECRACDESQTIVGSRFSAERPSQIDDHLAAAIFRHNGWTGDGDRMLGARCPACSQPPKGGA